MANDQGKEGIVRFLYGLEGRRTAGPKFNEAPMLEQEDEEFSAGATNRGNKTLFNSDTAHVRTLKSNRDNFRIVKMAAVDQTTGHRTTMIGYQDKRMSLDDLVKRELDEEYGAVSDDENDFYGDDACEYMDGIDFEDILGPIRDPADVVTRRSLSTIYKSKHLGELADETIHLIEQEQDNVNQLSRLMNCFLGDDPSNYYANTLKLPNYDHHLDLSEEMDQDAENDDEVGGTAGAAAAASASANGKADDKPAQQGDADATQEDDEQKESDHIVSNEADNRAIPDPFFKLPEFKKDFNYGIHKTEDAEEARQLIQIALQRNEEFIRSLDSIRMGFVRAERLKGNVYSWCKEIEENNSKE